MEIVLSKNPNDSAAKNYILLVTGFLFTIVLTFSFLVIGDRYLPIVFISFLPFIFISVFNFRVIYSILIISLFINLHFQELSSAVWVAILVPISTLICFRNFKTNELKLPITLPLLLYIITMIISLVNSIDFLFSILLMYNMFAFIFIVYTSSLAIRDKKEIVVYIILFLILNLFNSFHVIADGLASSRRAFGFAGIMFVDYVGIAITMNFILLLVSAGKNFRILLLISLLVLIAALLITQTRNAWLSTFLSLFFALVYLIFKSKKFKIRKSFLIAAMIASMIIMGSIFIFISSVNPEVTERAQETTKVEQSIDKEGQVKSSLVSRLLIWHTAYNAFLSEPVIGIGAYSFPFSSQEYYKVPRFIFEDYVEGLTPHQTFIAVAVETGLLGLFAFLFFLIASLKISFDTIKLSKTSEEKRFSFLLFSPLLYILISMTMTDAWLWGHGIILWGILLGFNLWNRKKLIEKNVSGNTDSSLDLNTAKRT